MQYGQYAPRPAYERSQQVFKGLDDYRIADILEARVDGRTLAMSKDDLHLLQLKISRVQVSELGWTVRLSWSKRGHRGSEWAERDS